MKGKDQTNKRNYTLTLASWNVKGLGHPIKRGKVFNYLKSLKADILFLQETHIAVGQERKLRASWISQVYQAPFSSKARGVAILFRKGISFQLDSMTTDSHGRYVMISGRLGSLQITMLNIYGPNIDDSQFFKKVFDMIPSGCVNVIIGGDFNCYLDPFLDRSSSKPPPTINSVQILNRLIKERNMVDIWRLQHPTEKDYSFYSHVHKTYIRIDHFLITSELVCRIAGTKYHNMLISDHSPITLELNNVLLQQSYHWRFNPGLLKDTAFGKYMEAKFDDFFMTNDNSQVSDSVLWDTFKAVRRGYTIAYEAAKKKKTILGF